MDFMMSVLSGLFKIDEQINNFNRNGTFDDNIVTSENIPYTDREKLDILYKPNMDIKYPVIINIHGGGWLVGDKKWRKGIATLYAEAGFFVINPNYSLSPAYAYPECIRDIFRLMDWIETNSDRYSLDLDNIFMTGDSAGAHLTAVVAGLQNFPKELIKLGLHPLKHKIVKVALFCGVYDYDKCVKKVGAAGLVKEMTGYTIKKYKHDFAFYKELSPINYVDEKYPPTYMVSAPFDIFCDGQAKKMETKLKSHGVRYEHYIPLDKLATHCFHLNLYRHDSIEAITGAVNHFREGTVLEQFPFKKKRVGLKITFEDMRDVVDEIEAEDKENGDGHNVVETKE